jgi:Fe-S oxidoreductase/nitrate reductase gamma subunit
MNTIQDASREILWNVSHPINSIVMYGLFALSASVFGLGLVRRLDLWLQGTEDPERLGNFSQRLSLLFEYSLGQREVVRKAGPGLFHTLILWGFLVLLFTTTIVFLDHDLGIEIYQGRFYLALTILSDLFGLGFLLGIILAVHTRYSQSPDRLHSSSGDMFMLALLAALIVQGFMLEGLRIHATDDPWALYSPVGYAVANFFWGLSQESTRLLHFLTWWTHTVSVFVFIALLPYSKFLHIISSSANLFFKQIERPRGAMRFIGDMEKLMEEAMEQDEDEFSLGTSSLRDMTWKQRLDLDACTSCGRCQEVCPAYESGKILSPKWLILDTRNHMLRLRSEGALESKQNGFPSLPATLRRLDQYLLKHFLVSSEVAPAERALNVGVQTSLLSENAKADSKLAGELMNPDVFWSCTTCGACQEVCPVGIDHVDLITDVRRSLVLMEGDLPNEAQGSLRAIETRGNPFGPAESRFDWAEGLDVPQLKEGDSVDLLYWVGCISAFDTRKQKIAQSMVNILNASGLSWGTLGPQECCTGDPARRLGEENLFQSSAKQNIATLRGVQFKRVVANCPHCFNSLKNEYPQLGAIAEEKDIPILHHSHLISELIEKGLIKISSSDEHSFTFHDPCYLGRYNDTYIEPREILVQLGNGKQVTEMSQSERKAKCCGAGGGHYWFDMKVGERVNSQRVDQAAATGASTIATGCPFCMQMLEDGVKLSEREESLEVRDIAELVSESLILN